MAFGLDTLIIIFLVFLAAGTIKGMIGIGLPTIAISLMSQLIDARLAISLTIIPMLSSNIWQVYRSGRILETLQKYRIFAALLTLSILVTSFYSKAVPSNIILLILGCAIIGYALLGWFKWAPDIPDRHDRAAQLACGVSAGILGGFTAIWAPPLIIYLTSRKVPKDEFMRATGLLITVGAAPLLIGYLQNGLLTSQIAAISGFMILPALLGFGFGEYLRRFIAPAKFYGLVLFVFAIMGINLIYRALGA